MFAFLWLLLSLLFDTVPDPDADADEDADEEEAADDEDEDEGADDTADAAAKNVSTATYIRDQRLHKASQQAKRHRLALRAAEEKLAALPTLRLENAFLRATREQKMDVETAWDLFIARGFADSVKLEDDGTITNMDRALEALMDRYPWLADADSLPDPAPVPPSVKGARRQPDAAAASSMNRKTLESRFPALRRDK
jgi:hypothetical protein